MFEGNLRRRQVALGVAVRVLICASFLLVCSCAAPPPPKASAPTAAGDASSCTNCYQEGLDARSRGELAGALLSFERGCEQQDAEACDAAARMYAVGQGAPEDDARASNLYARACDLGHLKACADLGSALVIAKDPATAEYGRKVLGQGCEGGSGVACGDLAISYLRGHGGPVDLELAVRTWARSCELGYGPSCTSYGVALLAGEGVAADPQQARSFLERGCDAGNARGCGRLGAVLRDGVGGPADAPGSIPYLERGCDGGYLGACVDLGAALYRGDGGIEVDKARAVSLFETTCEAGFEVACNNLEKIADAERRSSAQKAGAGGSTSTQDVTSSTGQKSAEQGGRATTSIGSMTIGQGSQTATFSDVGSTCSMLPLTLAFGSAAGDIRECLSETETRRISLVVEAGQVISASVDPDDEAGRCVTTALQRAHLGNLTCTLEASVSR